MMKKEEFTQEVQRIREEEMKHRDKLMNRPESKEEEKIISDTFAIIKPVVDALVSADSMLQIQSAPSKNFDAYHLVYAYTKSLRLSVYVMETGQVHIVMIETDGSNFKQSTIYFGLLDKKNVESSLQAALLQWYRHL